MILAYQISVTDESRVQLRIFGLDIREGGAWMGTPFPLRPDRVLQTPPSGIQLKGPDKRILMSAVMHQKVNGDESLFTGADATRLLENLLPTCRAYLAVKGSFPLQEADTVEAVLGWVSQRTLSKPTVILDAGWDLIPGKPCYAVERETGRCAKLTVPVADTALLEWMSQPALPPEKTADWLEKMSRKYPGETFPVAPGLQIRLISDLTVHPVLHIKTADLVRRLPMRAHVLFRYGAQQVEEHTPGELLRWVEDGELCETQRQVAVEQECLEQVLDTGLVVDAGVSDDLFARVAAKSFLKLDGARHPHWPAYALDMIPSLKEKGWEVEIPKELQPHVVKDEDWYSEIHEQGRGSYQVEQGIIIDGKRINLMPILRDFLIQHGELSPEALLELIPDQPYPLSTPFGLLLMPGERFRNLVDTLMELFGSGSLDRNQRLRVHAWRAAELFTESTEGWTPPPELLEQVKSLRKGGALEALTPPETFQGHLRPYQESGVGWIDFLYRHQLGGVLADDMGLGKTVQVIAALLYIRETHKDTGPVMIVSPASVMPNWKQELKRFAPSLKVGVHYGTDRRKASKPWEKADILLTTYGTLMRDAADMESATFSMLVLDEAQAIKNPLSQITKAVLTLNAKLRLALSGTPLENHLGELHSLFQFVLPGYLGTEKQFKMLYRDPIEKENATPAQHALHRRIRPLLLRRTKDLVAADLPPKTEIIREIDLTPEQVDLYEVVRISGQQELAETLQEKGFERSKIHALDMLLKLRQVCCDPRLCRNKESFTTEHAAKLMWLRDNLPEMIEEGRRVLLFSQFTSMLDLIIPEVKKLKIPFVEIRGSTKDREKPVERFQNKEVPLFLISLKAGGTGLNLTAADTVIFYDPWWNPAVEAQAADRAHRIGQDKPVFIYKLISRGTVEARILGIQERKKELQSIVSGRGGAKLDFTEEDFQALVAPMPREE
jgi:superfamily II DNA or RNA helicase